MNQIVTRLEPQQSPLVETRLLWMRDNDPDLLMELWKNGTLQAHVLKEVEEANQEYWTMIHQGTPREIAQELRLNQLAPADGMDASKEVMEIPDKTFNQILEDVMS